MATEDELAGMSLLIGTIAGQLSQLAGIPYPIKILSATPLIDDDGNYRNVLKVTMASGTYYVSVTDYDPMLTDHKIEEEP